MRNRIEGETSRSKESREMAPESSERVDRRAFVQWAAGAVAGAAVAGGFPEIAAAQQKGRSDPSGGSLYMPPNEIQNAIIHYHRDAKGALAQVKRVPTGGTGSRVLAPTLPNNPAARLAGSRPLTLSADPQLSF